MLIMTLGLLCLTFLGFSSYAQQSILSGRVIDASNDLPLSNVNIKIEGTSIGAVTDEKGEFRLSADKGLPFLLTASYIGYQEKYISINSFDPLTISMQESAIQLEEILVSSGYDTRRKSEFSGSVSRVSMDQMQNRPTTSFDQLLGGQATGVDIVQSSSVLNNAPVMRVRGINTITSGLYPLVVIDGVTVFVGSIGGLIGNNPLSDINPNDIESIDVLKDAAAAAIYGSRAANGVMVITTKKGRGKTKVNYDTWFSVSTPYNLPELLSAEDYVMIKNEAMVNAGKEPGFALMQNPDGSTVDTNWYDVAYEPGLSQSHHVSISGAHDSTRYYLSMGYLNQNSFIKTNNFERFSARINIDHQLNKRIKIGTNVSMNKSKNTAPNTGAISSNSMSSSAYNTEYITNEGLGRMTYVLPPNVPVYNEDGSYSIQNGNSVGYGANDPSLVGSINAYNLAATIYEDKNTSDNNSLIGNVFGELEVLKNLTFRTSLGANFLQAENKSFLNPLNGGGASANGVATNSTTKFSRIDFVNSLIYRLNIHDKHAINALVGHEKITTTIDGWGAQQSNLTDPSYTLYQGVYKNISPSGNQYGVNGLLSYFASVNYDYKKKYLVSVNFRRDGLSALAEDNKYGNFGSGSLGWNVDQESFYKTSALATVLTKLKIRGSYGIVGNSEIGDYASIGTYSSSTYGGSSTLGYSQTANPDLKWEKSTKMDIGFNASLLNNRVNIEFDYYKNLVDGLILQAPQALSAGLPNNYINANVGRMYNKGIELNISALIIKQSDFGWNASFNLSTLENKVTELVSDVFVPSVFGVQNMTRVGYSVGSLFAVPCAGVNPDNGQMMFVNSEGNTVQYNHIGSPKWTYLDGSEAPAIDNYKDGVIQGPSLPTVYGGINNSFTYKNFDLNINFTFVGGNKLYNGTRATNSDQRYFNNGTFIKDRWTTPGQVTEIQKLYYGDNVSAGFSFSSSTKVESGAYMKLKNLSLGYHVPVHHSFLSGTIDNAYLYVQSSNVFTITNYRGSDPEISINGNSINSGKDQNVPPTARVFTVGLNVQF
ncbi:SusC/RagA family TonB-linked outer membrane protein [Reichenbachiella agariperforans]|uniref:SusC/RagA family TonB-linked outer membrane protein n=1 Tax=Reichenbachiella agariperforans TaxID=156994 RepID=UPI001C0979B6|nr:SusC/RagA family TonB-linked outer membrane protein [Reichenbachiella agariperforans]MBU2915866.1 SusC/RagA family TonB-linked outer membrane protein [Reichenbachiella agariperforans]